MFYNIKVMPSYKTYFIYMWLNYETILNKYCYMFFFFDKNAQVDTILEPCLKTYENIF
jgi:hypothetical protein